MSIRITVVAGTLGLLVLSLLVGVVGLSETRELNQRLAEMYTRHVVDTRGLFEAQQLIAQLDLGVEELKNADSAAEREDDLGQLARHEAALQTAVTSFHERRGHPREDLLEFTAAYARYVAARDEVIRLSKAGQLKAADDVHDGELGAAVRAMNTTLQGWLEREDRESLAAAERGRALAEQAATRILVALALAILLGLLVARRLTRTIAGLAAEMTHAAARISRGEVAVSLPRGGVGEVGTMRASFRETLTHLERVTNALETLERGELGTRVQLKSERDALGRAFNRLCESLDQLTRSAERLAQGELGGVVDPRGPADVLGHAFVKMLAYLRDIVGGAQRLADGDLTNPIIPRSPRDLLGAAFERAFQNLRMLLGKVREAAGRVDGAASEITHASSVSARTVEELGKNISSLAAGAARQHAEMTQVTGQTEEIFRVIQSVKDGARDQVAAVDRARTSVESVSAAVAQVLEHAQRSQRESDDAAREAQSGVGRVQHLNDALEAMKTSAQAAATRVAHTRDLNQRIGMIAELVGDISRRTNVLALNASIAASHDSSDASHSFGVVASEVRELARQTAQSTTQVSTLVTSVREASQEVEDAMRSLFLLVDDGITRAADVRAALETSHHSAQVVSANITQITAGAEVVARGASQVMVAMKGVSEVVKRNASSMEELSSSGTHIRAAVDQMSAISQSTTVATNDLAAQAQELIAAVDQTAAAAKALQELSGELMVAVGRFRLPAGGGVPYVGGATKTLAGVV
ncbi:MAG: methyl-accepting chemotaxis protein [Myxococcota bacterium]